MGNLTVWENQFTENDRVLAIAGIHQKSEGVVASKEYCLGQAPEQQGKDLQEIGIQEGLVPVIFDKYGCFWVHPKQLKVYTKGECDLCELYSSRLDKGLCPYCVRKYGKES